MSLIEKIDNSIKSAMKSKDSLALESLRAVKSAILLFKTQSGSSNDLSSDDEIKILQKLVINYIKSFKPLLREHIKTVFFREKLS